MLECGRNIEVMYLLSKLTPDFRTIANFRRDNAKALRNVFRAFVKLCSKLGLYQKTLLAVDGTKIRAQNGDDHAFNKEILETDPEARRMHSKDGFHCCYNVQTAVDAGSHLIADYEGTALSLELQIENKFGCFSRFSNNTVICPVGNVFSQVRYREKRGTRVYGNRDAAGGWDTKPEQ